MLWTLLAMAAVLWPSRFIGPLDGAPLDRPLEAIALGLALPWLLWLGYDAAKSRAFRIAVIALLSWKAGTSAIATQQGLCATFQAPEPLSGTAYTMRISEPHGYLRSWDLRADLWAETPRCTAILTRPLYSTEEFPAWFVNLTDQMLRRRDFTMTVSGVVTKRDGTTTPYSYTQKLGTEPWQFNPAVYERDPSISLVTTATPTTIDRIFAPWAWMIAPLLCIAIIAITLRSAIAPLMLDRSALLWVVAGTAIAIALALTPMESAQRAAGVVAFGALIARWSGRTNPLKLAGWLIAVPWLAFFAVMSLRLVGKFSAYSTDDWLAYQIAGYRIFMNGNWIEGGTLTFDYQMLYRWVTGALHVVFGDSSVGELYWDASCLAIGALLAFALVQNAIQSTGSFGWAVGAAAVTLATLTLATPWYIIGRGLSEITAAGLGFLAIAALLRADGVRMRWVAVAALCAGLMFFARQNQLLWAPTLAAMFLPLSAGADVASTRAGLSRIRWSAVALYLGGFAAAVLAFMTRTWYFTGQFALFFGTSLRHNDTGWRPWHLFDAEAWGKVGHSLMGFVFMNEPPHVDPRAVIVALGALVSIAAIVQLPMARRIPAGLLLITVGGVMGAFVAHSHAYPGRFTVHIVPLAAALTAIAASAITNGFTGSDWRVSQSSGR